ncbi:hypothetical protein A5757_04170 [Mycobacterium sp. 852013-51886_SCH5428379]|uniref:substrate-binding domain-containing protein n=1 Tax=Mycobacterium sp. 852013-51886_SCH5428379 TaxID=1834111 RepID=UPI0007FE98AD|nr:substrate-binding domain-containing protein [Mycobacterium sp. 852013-51886_SCH5428379]OBB55695.1 hypothetical protein A5757_04170 [Mycobacterium sp. 852013-51886_SCH5428379]
MGRHSLPDPEDRSGDPEQPYADDATEAIPASPTGDSGPATGAQRTVGWDNGEWTGSHRSLAPQRRKVSTPVIAALVAVVVVVGAVIAWRFFGDALDSRSDAAAARCVSGQLDVAVVADPSIAQQIQKLADGYNETASPVGDRCVQVGVRPAGSGQVLAGFGGDWPGDLGERPALWIPASSLSAARLEAATGPETISDARSLVTSPVVLAVPPQLLDRLGERDWSTLPGLQNDPAALDGLGLPGWGPLKLALPRDSDASYLAAEAVATTAAPEGAPATDGIGAVTTLAAGAPELSADTTDAAMDALLDADDPAAAEVHAVPLTEQQLFSRAASLPDAKDTVAGWRPAGPTATADYPTVLLAGDWLDREQIAAASEFARFMRDPARLSELAAAGFRTGNGSPPPSDVVDFAAVPAPMAVGNDAERAEIAEALTSPAQGATTTLMLDLAMPAQEGANSRMGNVVNALIPRIEALPPTSAVGLWTFNATSGTSQVPLGTLSERRDALTTTLDQLSSTSGGAVSFTTLRLVYNQALANFRPGQPNAVTVITQGPHTDQTLDGPGLEAFIRDAFDEARPVAVNVIDFGDDPDRATWEAITQATGGTFQGLTTSDSPELAAALTTMLR